MIWDWLQADDRLVAADLAGKEPAVRVVSARVSELFRQVTDRRSREGLSRLLRYCTANEIEPEQVDDAVLEKFRTDLDQASLVNKPREVHRLACMHWNKTVIAVAAWPQQRLVVPIYRFTYAVPWTSFPESLKAEVDAYLHRLAGKDLFADHGFRRLRPRSLEARAGQIHNFVSALVRRGRDPQTLHSLHDVVAVDTVKDGLRFFIQRPDGGANKHAYDIACLMLAIARHFVQVDADHLEQQGDQYWLRFEEIETKTDIRLEMPVPEILAPHLEKYLSVYRPYLCAFREGERYPPRQAGTRLWVSVAHGPMSGDAIYDCITKWTKARFGYPVNPHRFRDSAATSIAIDDPEHVYMTKSILGHSTLQTAERYYTHANSLKALRGHQERMRKLRRQALDARQPARQAGSLTHAGKQAVPTSPLANPKRIT